MPDNVKKKMFIYKNGRYVVPETPDLENIIGEAIQADKNILSQIVYDEDSDTLILPKYVMPLRLTISSTDCYFDYSDTAIYNYSGEYIGDFRYETDHIEISSVSDISDNPVAQQIDYILSDNGMEQINSYYLYHPITESGTKLYKHTISDNSNYTLEFISTRSSSFSRSEITNAYDLVLEVNHTGFPIILNEIGSNQMRVVEYDSGDGYFTYWYWGSGTIYAGQLDDFNWGELTDTVTEL